MSSFQVNYILLYMYLVFFEFCTKSGAPVCPRLCISPLTRFYDKTHWILFEFFTGTEREKKMMMDTKKKKVRGKKRHVLSERLSKLKKIMPSRRRDKRGVSTFVVKQKICEINALFISVLEANSRHSHAMLLITITKK